MKVVFVISTLCPDTREFVRRAAQTPEIAVKLLRGDASLGEALTLFQWADRVWFEGAGPLFDLLLERPHSDWIPGVVLRINEGHVGRLSWQRCWRLVTDLIVPSRLAEAAVAHMAAPPVGRARIHVTKAVAQPAALTGPALDERINHLAEILLSPPGDLPLPTWQRIVSAGDACRGDVLVLGESPARLLDYLHVSLGCRTFTSASTLPAGKADAVLFWEDLRPADAAAGVAEAARLVQPGGSVIAVTPMRPGPQTLVPEAAADVFRSAPWPGGAMVQVDDRVVTVTVAGTRDDAAGRPAGAPPTESEPLVSAVVPAYNAESTIDRALVSLRRQTYTNLEILVIDDGSTDGTARAVEKHLLDPRVRYVHKPHSGRPDSRNRGVQESRGRYIAWLDGDDEALPNRIRVQVAAAVANPDAEIIHGDGLFMEVAGGASRPARLTEHRRHKSFTAAAAPALCLRGCPILNTALMVRRTLYERLGGYDPSFPRGQDYEFFVRAAVAGNVTYVHIPAPLVKVYQMPLDRPELLPIRLDTYTRLSDRLLAAFGEGHLLDSRSRDLNESPRLAIARVLVAKALMRGAGPGHPLLVKSAAWLEEVAGGPRAAERAVALALLARLARLAGNAAAAADYARRASDAVGGKIVDGAATGAPLAPVATPVSHA